MHTTSLPAHFVDGYAEFRIDIRGRAVEMTARDFTSARSYRLVWDRCRRVEVLYPRAIEDEEWDRYHAANLNELDDGIAEVESGIPGVRTFRVDFFDLVLEIDCAVFLAEPLPEGEWPSEASNP